MPEKPKVNPNEWITIGEKGNKGAVVCTILDGTLGDCEVVYLDDRNRSINEEVKWVGTHWDFVNSGPCGGYADKYPRLSQYVQTLKRGRYK